jgi:hypothetical protein
VLVSVQEEELQDTLLASRLEKEGLFLRAIYNLNYVSDYDATAWVRVDGNRYYNYITEMFSCMDATVSFKTAARKAQTGKWVAICTEVVI